MVAANSKRPVTSFKDGSQLFANVGGTFVSLFVGQNLTDTTTRQAEFRSIKGSMDSTVTVY